MKRADVTPELLRDLLVYSEDTGVLTWKERDASLVQSQRASEAMRWNGRYAGRPAFTALNSSGYLSGAIFKVPFLAHVVAWAITFSDWPRGEIDHINGVRSDNRLINLRDVTSQENRKNRKIPSNNTSGIIGVSFNARDRLWASCIGVNGRHHTIGHFHTKEEAAAARARAEETLGYHQSHGRYS